ncbi:hypothetical protein EMERY_102 [Brevibacillus phage Emery]|nr:hypothetical protein EMERY_102 [Brevibacillus phage Emery]
MYDLAMSGFLIKVLSKKGRKPPVTYRTKNREIKG